jgi:3-methylfumaryl-CoA hydratase
MSETSYQDYVGRSEEAADTVSPHLVHGLAATLDIAPPDRSLPPLWHWMLFQNWVPAAQIGADGHPRRGGFLPPVHDLPRRMWAGGRLHFLADIPIGARLHRRSTILAIRETSGGSGPLVFVTLRHEIATEAGPAIVEEQDIVYRGAEGAAVKPAAAAPEAPAGAGPRGVARGPRPAGGL